MFFFFASRRRHTSLQGDWSSDVCSSDLRFGRQLTDILRAVGRVAELELGDVEPTLHPIELVNVLAEDDPQPSLSVEEALRSEERRVGKERRAQWATAQ